MLVLARRGLQVARQGRIIGQVRPALAAMLMAALLAALTSVTGALADSPSLTIGYAQSGAPLVVYQLGSGTRRVLVVGGQHGGPERNTVELVEALLEHFAGTPEDFPPGLGLDIITAANPDGLAIGSRQFLSGVDPNRNWGGSDWRSDAYDSNARFRLGLGGPEPFSEPETQALAEWVLANPPALVINYHSAGGFMFGPRDGKGGELAATYADWSGYGWPGGSGSGGAANVLGYRASGSMNVWLRELGIPAILVELTTPWSPEIERNLIALRAVLQRLAES